MDPEIDHARLISVSAPKKVRKGGFRSAMRTFLIFGSAFGPHLTQKVGIFSPIDDVRRFIQVNPKVTLLTSDYGIVCGVSLVAIITVTT